MPASIAGGRTHRRSHLIAAAILPILALAACTAALSPSPSESPASSVPASPSGSTPSPSGAPSAEALPGGIEVLMCPTVTGSGVTCLGRGQGTVTSEAKAGSRMTVAMNVTNPGSSPSTAISLLLYELDAGPLPFGTPTCPGCTATASRPFVGLEWQALAPGESRQLTFDVPMTASAGGKIWFASLYGASLADTESASSSGGIQPGLLAWKVSTTVAP